MIMVVVRSFQISDAEVASMLGSLPREESRLVFGASADVSLWHRRLAHKVNAQHLRRIWKENLVDGLSLKGNLNKLTTLLRASTDCMYVVFLLRMHSPCTSLAFLFICWEEDPTPFHRGVIDGTF